jgi:hypothetical protein
MEPYVMPIWGISLSSRFIWGFLGSLAVEIMSVYNTWDSIPCRYKQISFWMVRIAVACIGGGLAHAYNIENNLLLAANIGASAPAIINSLQGGIRQISDKL